MELNKLLAATWLLASCSIPCYPNYDFGNFTSYQVTVNTHTPKYNIGVDDPKHELNLIALDAAISNVSKCVQDIANTGFTDEEFVKGECWSKIIDASIKSCLTIKVAPDWRTSVCSGEQVFPCNIDNTRCLEKGLVSDARCPCSCRAIIQDGNVIVVTPNLKLLPAQITTMMTGCLSPWVGRLAICADPAQTTK